MKVSTLVFAAALAALSSTAAAQPVEQMARAQGVVASLEGETFLVEAKGAAPLRVRIAADTQFMTSEPVDVDAVQPGRYIGTANMDQADGSGVSTEVHIFAASEPGPGINAPWGGGATMTNGAVASVADTPQGRRLQIDYGAGKKTVLAPPGTPIVLLTPTRDRSLLKAGAAVKVAGPKQADGSVKAVYLTVDVPAAAR